jgi:hypothetical protein
MKAITVLFVLLIQISCTSEVVSEKFMNGQIKSEYKTKNGEIDGEYKEYNENGNIKIISQFKDGKQDGILKVFHENGNLERETSFSNGIQAGALTVFYSNGDILEKSRLVNGVKEGRFISYFINKNLKEYGWLKAGKRVGFWKFYNEKGGLLKGEVYKDGVLINRLENTNSELIQFSNDEYEIFYPKKWKANYYNDRFIAKSTEGKFFKTNVNVVKFKTKLTLEQFFEEMQNEVKNSFSSFKVLGKQMGVNDGCESIRVVSESGLKGGVSVLSQSSYMMKDGVVYIISCVAEKKEFESLQNIFNLSTNCFRFKF